MISLTIVTCHDVFQRVAAQRGGVFTQEYQERSAVVLMSTKDMNALGIEDGATVKLSSKIGSVVVQSRQEQAGQLGFGYMPMSLYSSMLSDYEPAKAKLPNFKHIEVTVEPTKEAITPVAEVWHCVVGKG